MEAPQNDLLTPLLHTQDLHSDYVMFSFSCRSDHTDPYQPYLGGEDTSVPHQYN